VDGGYELSLRRADLTAEGHRQAVAEAG
jgi:hypothetical protein